MVDRFHASQSGASNSVTSCRFGPLLNLRRLEAALVLPLLAQACGNQAPERMAAHWQAYGQGDRRLLGWMFEGQTIALAGLRMRPQSGAGELLHLAIAPAWRAQGLGRELLVAVQDALGLWRLDAETDAEALDFYRRLGWAWAPLPTAPQVRPRFGVYWLDPGTVLQADFRFPAPRLDRIYLPSMPERSLGLLRLDLLHPLLQGNKWFKLRPHLLVARVQGRNKLLTMGGAWSNHLLATAAAGRLLGFETQALVRGELPDPLNPILSLAEGLGMKLTAVSRTEYRVLRDHPEALAAHDPEAMSVPEGGASELGVCGAADILDYLPEGTRALALACGTATTLAGLVRAAPKGMSLTGVSVLKGDFLAEAVRGWVSGVSACTWEIETRFHAGGYARVNTEFTTFLEAYAALNSAVPIEPVYTGKLLWAMQTCLRQADLNALPDAAFPLLLHTGGIWPAIDLAH